MTIRVLCVLGHAQGDVRTPDLVQTLRGRLEKKGAKVDLWNIALQPLLQSQHAAIAPRDPDSALSRFAALARHADAFVLASTVRYGRCTSSLHIAVPTLGAECLDRRPFALLLCGEGARVALSEMRRAAVSVGGVSIDSHYHEELCRSAMEEGADLREFAPPWSTDRLAPLVDELLLFASSLRTLRTRTRLPTDEFAYPLTLLGAVATQGVAAASELGLSVEPLQDDIKQGGTWSPKVAKLLALLAKAVESLLSTIGVM